MDHTATLLPDGRILIVGGWNSLKNRTVASVDLFDPATNTFTPAAPLPASRHEQAAALLPNGDVLLTGGLRHEPALDQTLNDAYVYLTPPVATPIPSNRRRAPPSLNRSLRSLGRGCPTLLLLFLFPLPLKGGKLHGRKVHTSKREKQETGRGTT
jgi:hypothetical protein